MGLLQEISDVIGGDTLKRLSAGKGNFDQPDSADQQSLQDMIKNADPKKLDEIFGRSAQQIDPQEYSDHVTPGVGGTDPLGNLGAGGLGAIASALANRLKEAGAGGPSALGKVPGLQSIDPKQMDADDVAAMARYTQQNHPEAFGKAASQISQQQPGLLHGFLGKAVLAMVGAALASHFIKTGKRS
jgi:hypothetical protein